MKETYMLLIKEADQALSKSPVK